MYYDKRNRTTLAELAPNTRALAMKWYEYLVKNGIEILVYDARRTLKEQQDNVDSGASQTMYSYHLVGQALDFVPADKSGKVYWSGYGRADIKKAIKEAQRLGFTWGGDWDSDGNQRDETFIDSPHLQYEYKGYGTDKMLGTAPAAKSKPAHGDGKAIVPFPGKPLYIGAKGMKQKDVERIQRAVGALVTGKYDKQTETKVSAYQKRKKLDTDGVVGLATWNTLF
ncbi:peptidoglycan-binding protein [Exiguobacterium acetylicum]|uniref:peptidoglycan-binding protein n=1 Tax=Exiguobacterium acetylicum TaxID=41170 RepID=UPI001EE1DE30|nr:peptidoglycan-binding protein [Exiguobacterium acetylicum]UKS54853.1 M15 family metallopeptidase [Exiguobacterium acetylicum]